jgi:hypothetical protein
MSNGTGRVAHAVAAAISSGLYRAQARSAATFSMCASEMPNLS